MKWWMYSKRLRAEKEEQMLFLQVIIAAINTGIISFNAAGKLESDQQFGEHLLQISPVFRAIADARKAFSCLLKEVLGDETWATLYHKNSI